jgi:hypothetical protein
VLLPQGLCKHPLVEVGVIIKQPAQGHRHKRQPG